MFAVGSSRIARALRNVLPQFVRCGMPVSRSTRLSPRCFRAIPKCSHRLHSTRRATKRDLIGDPFHVRSVKKHGATTRPEAWRIAEKRGFEEWLTPAFQDAVVARIDEVARRSGRRFAIGPKAFRWLTRVSMEP
jgi:hypothetical protein